MKDLTLTLTRDELACLEHLRNVGQFVNAMTLLNDSVTVSREPVHQAQLSSVIYLMTTQLDGVVERCMQRWLTEEVSA
ncbi:hypothetical protein AAEY27_19280 [Kosakonia sp. BYX6]|uniref:Uncharacterized protein n=1 Tax=Kosakonia calanthes TaxID=3139408 RepID=A0ABZ3B357_9ENTR